MITVIYHDRCHDGFSAALAAYLRFGSEGVRYLGANHGDPLPDIDGGDVYVMDFSYPLEAMQTLARRADRLIWLDHHASVLDMAAQFDAWLMEQGLADKVISVLDMNRSGAMLAWQHLHPGKPAPRLFRHVEDRDLWRWSLPGSEGFTSALEDLPFEFEPWQRLIAEQEEDETAYADFVRRGEIGHHKFLKLCADIAERAEPVALAGIPGLMVNAPGEFASHVGNILAEKSGSYGLIWHIREGMIRLSFRGTGSFDVIPLAAKFGGGGHKAAAGARIPVDRLSEILDR